MKIIPTLYIQHGKVVSFYRGTDNPQKKIYPKAPKTVAHDFAKAGADTLFVVDPDGTERERLPELREQFEGSLWWAGQVRDMETVKWLLENGADRVVLGWSAKPIFAEALQTYGPGKILAGIQFQHYEEAPHFFEELATYNFEDILVKDLNREGTLFQPNFDLMEKAVYFTGKNIYASGGVCEPDHLILLEEAGVKGAMVARALYEHRLSLN